MPNHAQRSHHRPQKIAIVWFRQDLRLQDNPALTLACREYDAVIPVFIEEEKGNSGLVQQQSRASHVWLHHSLQALEQRLHQHGNALLLLRGEPLACLEQLVAVTGAEAVCWNRRYDPVSIAVDAHIKQQLSEHCRVVSGNGALLSEPWELVKRDGSPYRVFTAFWKAKQQQGGFGLPLAAPASIPAPVAGLDFMGRGLPAWGLSERNYLPDLPWAAEMMTHWQVGEQAALEKLSTFLQQASSAYRQQRDLPAVMGTSRLSPHLHFGEISPRQVYYQAQAWLAEHPDSESGVQCFLSEVGWREFAYSLLYHFPATVSSALDQRFHTFPWRQDDDFQDDLRRWQRGMTGFPIIDAGMRELWATGWMHNRVRMIVASLLTKNLLIPWQSGERWFRDTLVDADIASNTMGWQWVAGCGADAAPYFRIFNPLLQSELFDPQGEYIRRWVPELAGRNNREIHQPLLPGERCGAYPLPMVDLKTSRARALACFASIKAGGALS